MRGSNIGTSTTQKNCKFDNRKKNINIINSINSI